MKKTIVLSLLLSCALTAPAFAKPKAHTAAANANSSSAPASDKTVVPSADKSADAKAADTATPFTGAGAPPADGAAAGTVPAAASAAMAAASGGANTPAPAATPEGEELVRHDWPFQGAFGTYDRAALQRGFQVYKQVCSACHSMNLLSYRNLQDIGYTEGQVKAIAADAQVSDINDEGETVQRPGRPSDRFHAPFANKKASMAANNGAYPPDMSLLAKARHGGPDYIYAILTGFADPPADVKLQPGQYWNKAMPGHIIAMPPPLSMDGQVQYENAGGIPQTKEQYAKDVAQFLTWAAEPHMEERKQTGTKVFLFLLAFVFITYNVKKKVWRDVH